MKEISLNNGMVTIVDDEDYEYLMQWRWALDNKGYAVRRTRVDGKPKAIFIHRVINNEPDGMVIDHINGDTLDNRKSNLRVCTHKENIRNRRKHKSASSQFKGVTWRARYKKWDAQIKINGKTNWLGSFVNEIDAAIAYNKAASFYFGEFACLNNVS